MNIIEKKEGIIMGTFRNSFYSYKRGRRRGRKTILPSSRGRRGSCLLFLTAILLPVVAGASILGKFIIGKI